MPMELTPGFLSKGIILYALYSSVSSGFISSGTNFFAILATVSEISTDCCPKCFKIRLIHLHQGQMVHEIHAFLWLLS